MLVGDDGELPKVAKDVTARGLDVAPGVFEGRFDTVCQYRIFTEPHAGDAS